MLLESFVKDICILSFPALSAVFMLLPYRADTVSHRTKRGLWVVDF